MPVHITSVPFFTLVLFVLPNGASFVGTKSPAVSKEMETWPGVLPSHGLTMLPSLLFAAALSCFRPQNELADFPVSQVLERVSV